MSDDEFYKIKNEMKEEWKQVILNNELQNYDVSNTGKIRNHTNGLEYKLSKTVGMKNCYEFFTLVLNDGSKRNIGIHRLMAIMFLPIPKKYIKKGIDINNLVVDHKDDKKYHNIIQNLQWLTPIENSKKWYKTVASLKDLTIDKKTIKKICEDLVNGMTIYEISKKYNVSELLVHDIRYRHRHRNISKDYEFPKKQISESDAAIICQALQDGMKIKDISKKYGYKEPTILNIYNYGAWKQISKNYDFHKPEKIKEEIVIGICEMLQDKKSLKEISEKYDVSKRLIQHIKAGETHKQISCNYTFDNSKFKVDDSVIHNVCKDLVSRKYTMKEISERNGISLSFVKDIKYKRHRTDISNIYF